MADKQVLQGDDFLLQYSTDGGTTKVDIPGWRRFDPKLTKNIINTEAAGDAIATGKPGRIMTEPTLNVLMDLANATELDALEAAWHAGTSIHLYWAYNNEAGEPLYGISAYVIDFAWSGEQNKEVECAMKFKPADPDWVSDPASATISA